MWGGMPGGTREGLCWCGLINLTSRASDFLLSNPTEFFKFETRGEEEMSEPCAGTGPGVGQAAPFRVSKCRGPLFVFPVGGRGQPLRTQGTRVRCLLAFCPHQHHFLWESFGSI